MPKCKYHKICGLDGNTEEDLCILHSQDPEKNKEAFAKALTAHRENEKRRHNFQHFVFPAHAAYFKDARFTDRAVFFYAEFTEGCDFSDTTFSEGADFSHARFTESAKFVGVRFYKGVKFSHATFYKGTFVDFRAAKFADWAYFSNATFGVGKVANPASARCIDEFRCTDAAIYAAQFGDALFDGYAYFDGTIFNEEAQFGGVTFAKGADFSGTSFGKAAEFMHARFLGRTRFLPRQEKGANIPSFLRTLVNFREVDMAPDAVVFQDSDLRKTYFLGTDLRKTLFTNVKWPEKRKRYEVYDQVEAERKGENDKWAHIEELYRQLKQNYEDRRDYERARHFHIGEKEMRRKNSQGWLKILLTAYRWVSGYGESCLLPLFWLVILLAGSALGYLSLGLWSNESKSVLEWSEWLSALGYSFRVMTLLRPDDLIPIGYAKAVSTLETLAGPILLGLFALALRQRLKR